MYCGNKCLVDYMRKCINDVNTFITWNTALVVANVWRVRGPKCMLCTVISGNRTGWGRTWVQEEGYGDANT